MKNAKQLGLILGILALVLLLADQLYVSNFEKRFKNLQSQRIITSNKLATAKIISENLNHVHDLVFKNMDIPGNPDTLNAETAFYQFVTSCLNDLKLKLISLKPLPPTFNGRITMTAYDLELEGDFFKFGELCSKIENSRRIVAIENFQVDLAQAASSSNKETKSAVVDHKGVLIKIRVNTYRIRKG